KRRAIITPRNHQRRGGIARRTFLFGAMLCRRPQGDLRPCNDTGKACGLQRIVTCIGKPDFHGRLHREANTYDDGAKRTSETWNDAGGSTVNTLSFAYNAEDELTSASDNTTSVDNTYDDFGRLATHT